jgi:ER membrane protein SH3
VSSILLVCGGFLLAVLWMDLMFDVQVLGKGQRRPELPEDVLSSIAAYYRRVTTLARPMGHLVGAMMLIGMLILLLQTVRGGERRWIAVASLFLFGMPAALALFHVYPNAVRLGSRADPSLEQSRLARAIHRDHLLCLGAMLSFVLLQLLAALW